MPRFASSSLLLTLTAAGLLLTLAACGADETVVKVDNEGATAVVDGTHVAGTAPGAVTLPLGKTLVVDFGYLNNSVGDDWFLVSPPDPAVLTDDGQDYDSECDESGCGADMSWLFGTAGAGSTTLTFKYCYRSRPPNCDTTEGRGPDEPVTLTVTVSAA